MKHLILFPFLAIAALAAVSCEKAEGGNKEFIIKGNIELPENETWKIVAYAHPYTGRKPFLSLQEKSVIETPVDNGYFELTLPATLKKSELYPIGEVLPNHMTSNPKAGLAYLLGFNILILHEANGTYASIRDYDRISFDDSHLNDQLYPSKEAVFIYADRPVKISGEDVWLETFDSEMELPTYGGMIIHYPPDIEHTTTYNLDLKHGWNVVCLESDYDSSSDPHKSHSAYSMKSLDGCKWNLSAGYPAGFFYGYKPGGIFQ